MEDKFVIFKFLVKNEMWGNIGSETTALAGRALERINSPERRKRTLRTGGFQLFCNKTKIKGRQSLPLIFLKKIFLQDLTIQLYFFSFQHFLIYEVI